MSHTNVHVYLCMSCLLHCEQFIWRLRSLSPGKAFTHLAHVLQTIRQCISNTIASVCSEGGYFSKMAVTSLKIVRFTNRNHRLKAKKLPYLKIRELFMHANCLWAKFAKLPCREPFMFYSSKRIQKGELKCWALQLAQSQDAFKVKHSSFPRVTEVYFYRFK